MKRRVLTASAVALAGLGIFLGGRTAKAEQQLSDMRWPTSNPSQLARNDFSHMCITLTTKPKKGAIVQVREIKSVAFPFMTDIKCIYDGCQL